MEGKIDLNLSLQAVSGEIAEGALGLVPEKFRVDARLRFEGDQTALEVSGACRQVSGLLNGSRIRVSSLMAGYLENGSPVPDIDSISITELEAYFLEALSAGSQNVMVKEKAYQLNEFAYLMLVRLSENRSESHCISELKDRALKYLSDEADKLAEGSKKLKAPEVCKIKDCFAIKLLRRIAECEYPSQKKIDEDPLVGEKSRFFEMQTYRLQRLFAPIRAVYTTEEFDKFLAELNEKGFKFKVLTELLAKDKLGEKESLGAISELRKMGTPEGEVAKLIEKARSCGVEVIDVEEFLDSLSKEILRIRDIMQLKKMAEEKGLGSEITTLSNETYRAIWRGKIVAARASLNTISAPKEQLDKLDDFARRARLVA